MEAMIATAAAPADTSSVPRPRQAEGEPDRLSPGDRGFLNRHGITNDVLDRFMTRSVEAENWPDRIAPYFKAPGILFWWPVGGPEDTSRWVPQFRPDEPKRDENGNEQKYVFESGCGGFCGIYRRPSDGCPVLLVEGTKQSLAAVSWAPDGWGVVGIPGCRNWVGADLAWSEGHRVIVLFDADVSTNRDVYDAAVELKDALEAEGAESVAFAKLAGATAKQGLDDVLGVRPADRRTDFLRRICDKARSSLGNKPARKKQAGTAFDEKGALLAETASNSVLAGQPAALAQGSMVALYRDGRYVIDRGREQLFSAVQELLGEGYRPSHRSAIEESLIGILAREGKRIPERADVPLLNCTNGMLDLRTGELMPHDPAYLSAQQIPVAWEPDAACPRYEAWIKEVIPDQVEDLEEVASTMLDPSTTPAKALFAFGPSHSGKSTFLRILASVVGPENRTGVTLHQLSDDKFAAANVYQRMLNVAADLSSHHVSDLSLFKMLTGEDVIHANRKYGREFQFTNTALFAFSANELPTVGEASRAYVNRIKPFKFPFSFEGREDPTIESAILRELPGILVRWVRAWQRFNERGGYLPTDPGVMREFETRSDRVALWVSEKCRVHPDAAGRLVGPEEGTAKQILFQRFKDWSRDEDNAVAMTSRKFFERLNATPGVASVRLRYANKNLGLNITERSESDEPGADDAFRTPESVRSVGSVPNQPSSPYVRLCEGQEEGVNGVNGQTESYGKDGSKATLPTLHTPDPLPAEVIRTAVLADIAAHPERTRLDVMKAMKSLHGADWREVGTAVNELLAEGSITEQDSLLSPATLEATR